MTSALTKRHFSLILLGHMALWFLLSYLFRPDLDAFGDMVENYAWSQTWEWGSFKHPPLLGWVVKLWFMIFPTKSVWYYLLAYVNVTVGLIGILFLARLLFQKMVPHPSMIALTRSFLFLVLFFSICSGPYSYLAEPLNADTILLSLWPWTTYAFFVSVYAQSKRHKWTWALFLGLMAALAILSKYYSVVLLLSLFLILLLIKAYRGWLLSPYPYFALSVFILLLIPHFYWEYSMNFPFLHYLNEKAVESFMIKKAISFLLSGFYLLPVSWAMWCLIKKKLPFFLDDALPIFQLSPLILLCLLPVSITIGCYFIFHIGLVTHWAKPIWFGLPILMATLTLKHIRKLEYSQLLRWIIYVWVAALLTFGGYALFVSAIGQQKYTIARSHMAYAIESNFQKAYPNQKLSWVGGMWNYASGVAFFLSAHPRALPGFPNEGAALVNPYPEWQHQYGVLVCSYPKRYNSKGEVNQACLEETRNWLKKNNLPIYEAVIPYSPQGWPYFKAVPKEVTVFWLPPSQLRENL